MNKVLINIEIPVIDEDYDMYIPTQIKIRDISTLIEKAAAALSNYLYVPTGNKFICWKEKNILLDENTSLEDYGVQNGDHLLLI